MFLFVSSVHVIPSTNGQETVAYQTDVNLGRAVSNRNTLNQASDQTMAIYPNTLDAGWYSGSLLRMHYLISQLRSPFLPYVYFAGVQIQRWLLGQLLQLTREQLLPRMNQFSAGLLSRNCEIISNQVLRQVKSLVQQIQQPTPMHRSPDN